MGQAMGAAVGGAQRAPGVIMIPKLGVGEKIAYGMGDFSVNIALGTAVLFLSYFYIDIYGLKPEHVGLIMLIVRCIDAVTDALKGALADRTKSRFGRYRPWMLWMAVPFGITTAAMFISSACLSATPPSRWSVSFAPKSSKSSRSFWRTPMRA